MRRIVIGLHIALALVVADLASAQVIDWPTERPPRPLAARQVNFPPYQVRTLPNGLQVVAVSHHEQPAVSIRLIVRAGGAQDPGTKPGVAYLAASLLDQGTTSKNAEQIATTIDSIGGAIGAGAGSDLTFINAAVMKDSLGLALDLVSELARQPAFAPEEIDRQRQQILSGLKVSYDDPDYLAGVVFDRLVYGFHAYGKPDSGTPESIAAITRGDLLDFHKRWFAPNNAILAIVGDVAADEAFAGAQRAFGSWPRIELPALKAEEPPAPTRRVVVIDRPGAAQTEIRAGNIALPRRHPDYLALDVAMKILGGEGGNRLHRVLRSERGLTYGASADLNALKDTGDIVAETDTRSEKTAEALRLMVEEIVRLQRQRVSTRELTDAQEYLTGSFPLTIETPSAIALQVLNAVFYGLDLNDLQTYRERVNMITVDDIQRVAQQYLRPDRLSIVLVGDASVFAKDLPGVGFEQVERISIADLDLGSPDLRHHGPPAAGRVEPIAFLRRADPAVASADAGQAGPVPGDRADALTLIARAIAAKGGLPLLRSIQTVRVNSVAVVAADGSTTELPSLTTIRYPSSYRVETQTPGGRVVQVFNAGSYWIQDARGTQDAPASVVEQIRGFVQRDTLPLLLALADGKVTAKTSETGAGGTRALEVVIPGGKPVTLSIDPRTGFITKSAYRVAVPGGDVAAEEIYSDYREVNGLMVAFKTELRRDGAPAVARTVRTYEFNIPVDPKIFGKPS